MAITFLLSGIRRICVVAFGLETKNFVAWYQGKEETITWRTKKLLGQARKCEVGAKPKPALRHSLNCEKPWDTCPGFVVSQVCSRACTLLWIRAGMPDISPKPDWKTKWENKNV